VRLDLFEGAEAEPLVKGASPLVDMKYPEREWFLRGSRATHQRTDDGRPDSSALPFWEDLDRSEDDVLGLILNDEYADVLAAGLNDLPALWLKAILEESRLLCVVPTPDAFDVLTHRRLVEVKEELSVVKSCDAQTPGRFLHRQKDALTSPPPPFRKRSPFGPELTFFMLISRFPGLPI
jgi:hypothetical protein